MKESSYRLIRRLLFWLSALAFTIAVPVSVYLSLGYKFDPATKKLLKTGAISIRTYPEGADVYFNGSKLEHSTPMVMREIFPQQFKLVMVKEGYYPYQTFARVKPAEVTRIEVVLLPKIANFEKMATDVNVFRFFVSKGLFGRKVIAFTAGGIFLVDNDLKNEEIMCDEVLPENAALNLKGLLESEKGIVFWNRSNIWMKKPPFLQEYSSVALVQLYKAFNDIKEVFFALKERYLIIQDGYKLIALDTLNTQVSYTFMELESRSADMFYDTGSETLFIKDRVAGSKTHTLIKINLTRIIPLKDERKED